MRNFLFVLIAFMFAEIATFIVVGKWLGVFPTLMLIVLTGALGVYMLKKQGTKSLQSIQTAIAQGQAPGVALVEAFMMFVGAVLLVLPGFLSDIMGLMMFTSFTRGLFKPIIFLWLRRSMRNSRTIIVQR
ncbi:FxsA family protein [Lysinibacillus sp. KU-BSD001]|uniref:FxsA family protein n=1 Tax=Lysinibacillus sp. KU-BSD001 TaxID=3141328 RepID=UPI0036EBF8D1